MKSFCYSHPPKIDNPSTNWIFSNQLPAINVQKTTQQQSEPIQGQPTKIFKVFVFWIIQNLIQRATPSQHYSQEQKNA